jgi:hypothetical protein
MRLSLVGITKLHEGESTKASLFFSKRLLIGTFFQCRMSHSLTKELTSMAVFLSEGDPILT